MGDIGGVFNAFRHPVFLMLEIMDVWSPSERGDYFNIRTRVNYTGSGGYQLVVLGVALQKSDAHA